MATKRTNAEGPVSKTAKPPPKRKMAVRVPTQRTRPPQPSVSASTTATTIDAPVAADFGGADVDGEISRDVIALRAYYLSEERRKKGIPGDSLSDWLEAERQILTGIAV